MLGVIILEDNTEQRHSLAEIVKNRIMINPSPHEYNAKLVLATADPQEVLDYVNQTSLDGLLAILDIDLKTDIDGIDVAVKLKNLPIFSQIVFVTADPDALRLTIQRRVAPLDYITKTAIFDQLRARLQETIDIAYQRYEREMFNPNSDSYLSYSRLRGVIERIPLEQVYYINLIPQRYNRIRLFTQNKVIDCIGTLSDYYKKYSSLVYADRDTLINLSAVKEFDYHQGIVYFDQQRQIQHDVSLRRRSKIRKLLKK